MTHTYDEKFDYYDIHRTHTNYPNLPLDIAVHDLRFDQQVQTSPMLAVFQKYGEVPLSGKCS